MPHIGSITDMWDERDMGMDIGVDVESDGTEILVEDVGVEDKEEDVDTDDDEDDEDEDDGEGSRDGRDEVVEEVMIFTDEEKLWFHVDESGIGVIGASSEMVMEVGMEVVVLEIGDVLGSGQRRGIESNVTEGT